MTSPDGMDDATGSANVGFKAATSATNGSNTNGSVKQTCLVERLQQIRIPGYIKLSSEYEHINNYIKLHVHFIYILYSSNYIGLSFDLSMLIIIFDI